LPGAYFLTICSSGYKHIFGRIRDGQVSLSRIGRLAQQNLNTMTEQAVHLELDYHVVMPNHLHAIVWILQAFEPDSTRAKHGFAPTQVEPNPPSLTASLATEAERNQVTGTTPKSVGSFVQAYKSAVTRTTRKQQWWGLKPLWQRNYYEHVIRNDYSLNVLREYIINNPLRWHLDRHNSRRTGLNPVYKWLDDEASKSSKQPAERESF